MRRITLLGLSSSFLLACRPGPATESPRPQAAPASSAPAELEATTRESDAAVAPSHAPTPTALCKAIEDDIDAEVELHACDIVASAMLDTGRADLVEVKFEEPAMGEVTQAFIALQSGGEEPSFELVGESYFVPGEEVTYVLGKLGIADGKIHVEVTETTTTFPNTGDPDADPEEEEEVVTRRFVCDVVDGLCEEQP